ncbi:winged helix-turn-helix domain-containing protein [Kitasatospora cineracea]|uniref:helix-turn-helix domain-containing protein n=1 Tax=Kitasatospora cineracea TaxID=88074 RepID=UPI0036DF8B05
MAELALPAGSLARIRFAVSPMWQVVSSFRLLRAGTADRVHRRWLDQVRPRTAAAGLDRGWLAELIPPAGSYAPDFPTPAPATELAHRTGLSPAHVSQNLTTLRDAGFVTAHRTGRSVLYARTAIAEAVLDAGR